MFGSVAGFAQTGYESAMNQFGNLARAQQAQQQSQQAYQQAMLQNQTQNQASKNAMTGAYVQAGGNIASSALGAYGRMGGGTTA